jgi:hypothetical protein
MSDNNGWTGKPGVPLNPERDGWHLLVQKNAQLPEVWEWKTNSLGAEYGDQSIGAWLEGEGDVQPEDTGKWYRYLGPCLTPAEVESHKHAAVIAYANLLNLPAPPNLIAQARRNALEEAARWHDEQERFWMEKGREVSALDSQSGLNLLAKAAEHRKHAAAIRALGEKDNGKA